MTTIIIRGKLIGHRLYSKEQGFISSDIVHVPNEGRPSGPAENAMVEVMHFADREISSYIPWVGYFDLDREIEKNPECWRIIEPAIEYSIDEVSWQPFKRGSL